VKKQFMFATEGEAQAFAAGLDHGRRGFQVLEVTGNRVLMVREDREAETGPPPPTSETE
jgi:hypothetical protein